jgi:5-methyltetrahydropteroyltriglutamate--homocysteine methyltransferase
MKRSEERILTTHTGSLIRPPELRNGFRKAIGPWKDPERYWHRLDQCVIDVVKKQVRVGLDIVNDGEYCRSSWASYVIERLSGYSPAPGERSPTHWLGRDAVRFPEVLEAEFPGHARGIPAVRCSGPITYKDSADVCRRLKSLQIAFGESGAEEAFFTVVAPGSAAFNAIDRFYSGEREYLFALAEALREEYLRVHEAGFVLQVDDALLANMYDHLVQESPEAYRRWAELRIDALNHALRGIPPERIRYHVCFGSWHAPHTADASLEDIVDLILRVNAGAYVLEAANARHEHEWRVWQKVKLPDSKILIPGVVTHHTHIVEHPRVVADRIVRFAYAVGRENVIAGTDCGFAQKERLQRTAPEVMWAKLETLVQGARLASRELWGR